MQGFLAAGGSVPGYEHTKPGQPGWTNNHDAHACFFGPDYIIGVVADGCGSTPHPEVGAHISVRLAIRHIMRVLERGHDFGENEGRDEKRLQYLRDDIAEDIAAIARLMTTGDNRDAVVMSYFLASLVCAVVTPTTTAVFSFGDGVVALNGNVTVIEPLGDNSPPYIGQTLVKGVMPEKYLKFEMRALVPTKEVQSVLLGTDGVNYLQAAAELPLPGKQDLVGPLSQFWTDDKYVTNSDCIRRRLALVNQETIDESGERPRIKNGYLFDDTTILVIKREKGA